MPAVACLIADPQRHPLDAAPRGRGRRALSAGEVRWLAEAEAAEILVR